MQKKFAEKSEEEFLLKNKINVETLHFIMKGKKCTFSYISDTVSNILEISSKY